MGLAKLQIWVGITKNFQLKQNCLSSTSILEILLLPCKTINMAHINSSDCNKKGKPNEGGWESAPVAFRKWYRSAVKATFWAVAERGQFRAFLGNLRPASCEHLPTVIRGTWGKRCCSLVPLFGIAYLCKLLREMVCFHNLCVHTDAVTSIPSLYSSFLPLFPYLH